MNKQITLSGAIKSIDKEKRIVTFTVSDGEIDRHGESLNPNGWKFENYLGNPVVLFGHDYKSLPIGKTLKIWVENGKQVMATMEMATHEFANEVFNLIQGGFLNATSVGLIPLKLDDSGNYTWAEQELLEISVVPVPANPRALAKEFAASYEAIEKQTGIKLLEDEEVEESAEGESQSESEEEPAEGKTDEPSTQDAESSENSAGDQQPTEKTVAQLTIADLKAVISEALAEALSKQKETNAPVSEEAVETPTDQRAKTLEAIRAELREADKGIGQTLRMIKAALAE